jgi:Sigma-70 region 2
MKTPQRREIGRPPTAQFAGRLVSVRDGSADKVMEAGDVSEATADLISCTATRMLGSFQDAEDALQDTLLAAWHGLERFEGLRLDATLLDRLGIAT